nr:AAA family ATPase [Conexibacter arvalis]
MHGRDGELGAIEQAVASAGAGERRMLAVSGESGIGKSALLEAGAALASASGFTVLRGRAGEHLREVAFGLVVTALDRPAAALGRRELAALPPELGAILPAARDDGAPAPPTGGPAERFRLHAAVRKLLERLGAERPLALVLDDVQWADEGTIELLLHLMRRPPPVPFLLLFALRPSRGGARLLDAGRATDGWRELRPAPLGRAAAKAVLGSGLEPAVRERVLRESDGRPLFLRELRRGCMLAAAHHEPAPDAVSESLARELEVLGPRTRALLDGAAIAGDPFDPAVAAAAAELTEAEARAALETLVAGEVVRREGDDLFGFRHTLVHQIVVDATPRGWRRDAHRRAAAALAAGGASPALRAHHVRHLAGPGDEQAVALFVEAAQASLDASPSVAAHWYAAALALLRDAEPARRAQLLAPLALALGAAGRLDESRAAFDDCLALLAPNAAERRAALLAAVTVADVLLGAFGTAAVRLDAALEEAPPAARPRLLHYRSEVAAFADDPDGIVDWADRAARELEGRDMEPLRAAVESEQALGRTLRGEPDQGLMTQAERRLRAVGDGELAAHVDAAWTVGGNLARVERSAEAAPVLRRGMRLARESLQSHLVFHVHLLLTIAELPLLELDAAQEHADAAEEVARLQDLSYELAFALALRAQALAARGERDAAREAARDSDALLRLHQPHGATAASRVGNALLLHGDDPERLLAALTRIGGEELRRLDRTALSVPLLAATRAALALGRHDEAQRWAERAVAAAASGDLPATSVRAERAAAEVLLAGGATAEARRVAAGAVRIAAGHGLLAQELEATLLHGRALAAAGERDQAADHLEQVVQRAARHGALALRDAASAELRRAGAAPTSGGR